MIRKETIIEGITIVTGVIDSLSKEAEDCREWLKYKLIHPEISFEQFRQGIR